MAFTRKNGDFLGLCWFQGWYILHMATFSGFPGIPTDHYTPWKWMLGKRFCFLLRGVGAWFFFVQGRTVAEKNLLVLGRVLHVYYTNSYKPSLVTWKGLQCRWYYVTWPYKLQSPSSWVIAPGELGKGSRLAGPWRIDSWNFRIWSRKKIHPFFWGKKNLSKKSIHFLRKKYLSKKSIHFFLEGG